ncbi:MAG: hypothetical protein P8P19_03085 [Polaribacter sp.]|jgi:flagellar biosynthesis/type III secretory pathway protein FliH|nr:hypothetical protein [Polaribacter sp.]MBT7704379.1 hypothetical protein [Polaribacter sp.]MDG1110969.1 hypothetical protein [Polaribacter sp.]MDG1221721.1 hypothetical protein [Polaribacter sp.]
MKKLVLVAVMAIGTTFLMSFTKAFNEKKVKTEVVVMQSDYEEGWEDGYCEGWKDVKGQYAICPITPICPIPEIGCSEGYKCGYNRGFKAGMKAAKEN